MEYNRVMNIKELTAKDVFFMGQVLAGAITAFVAVTFFLGDISEMPDRLSSIDEKLGGILTIVDEHDSIIFDNQVGIDNIEDYLDKDPAFKPIHRTPETPRAKLIRQLYRQH